MLPTLSIVTISYNQARFLAECVKSVTQQKSGGVEYIVVDPGSTDGSRELLKRADDKIDHLVLEPDAGPADGLNKGFSRARGQILGYINADDRFVAGTFDFVRRYFAEHPEIDVLCGSGRIIDEAGRVALRARTSDLFDVRRYAAGVCTVVQQATFFRRAIFARSGGFNPANRVAWDGELLVDLALAGACFATVRRVLGDFRVYRGTISHCEEYHGRLERYYDELEHKLSRHGIATAAGASRAVTRIAYKLNPMRHAGYVLAHIS